MRPAARMLGAESGGDLADERERVPSLQAAAGGEQLPEIAARHRRTP